MKIKNRLATLSACVAMLAILACNLAVRPPMPLPTDSMALTVTALSALLTTPSPAAWTAVPPAVAVDETIAPIPTAPELIRMVTGVSASYFSSPPVIDGDLSDWSNPRFAVASPVFGIENWKGLDDLSGSAMLGWDQDYLYIAVQVADDVYVQNATGQHIYQGDGLEILFDSDLAGDFYETSLNADDYQLGFSSGNPAVGAGLEAYQWLPPHLEAARPEVTMASRFTDVGYDLEMVIPWSLLDITPQAWQHYGLAISLSDNDKVATTIQQSMVSNTPDRRLTKPMTWGDMVLIK